MFETIDVDKIRSLFLKAVPMARIAELCETSASTVNRVCETVKQDLKQKKDEALQHAIDCDFSDESLAALGRLKFFLKDPLVIHFRKIANANKDLDFKHYADLLQMAAHTFRQAIVGQTFRHLNKDHLPFYQSDFKKSQRDAVRERYLSGETYSQIRKDTGIAKATLSHWGHDLVLEKREKIAQNKPPKVIKKVDPTADKVITKPSERVRFRNKNHVLTAENVIAIRKAIRVEGLMNLKRYADQYGVSIATISQAARGHTFKDVNAIEPPIVDVLPLRKRTGRSLPVSEELAQEVIALRKEDPSHWTYGTLAKWLSEKTGKRYSGGPVAQLILRRDPNLKALEEIKPAPKEKKIHLPKPKPTPKPKANKAPVWYQLECVVCENRFKSKYADAEICHRKTCHDIVAAYAE